MGPAAAPVVVMGDIVVDIIIRPDGPVRVASDTPSSIRLGLGGAGANTAVHLARQGVPTVLVGCIGDDLLGTIASAALKEAGVELAVETMPQAATGAIGVLVDHRGQRTMFPQRGANRRLDAAVVRRRWPRAVRGLFVSGYALFEERTRAAARWAMDRAKAAGVPVAVDPASYAMIEEAGPESFLEWCHGATVLLPNRDEAAVLARGAAADAGMGDDAGADGGTPTADRVRMEDALDRLGRLFPTVVIKLDRDGAIGRRAAEMVHAPAHDVQVVDTTGAGDAFNAGFFAAFLEGRPLAAAMEAGQRLAARVVQHVGAS